MLPVENNFNKNGLPHVYIALFRCLWVPGGGLEPFRRVLRSDGSVDHANYTVPRVRCNLHDQHCPVPLDGWSRLCHDGAVANLEI